MASPAEEVQEIRKMDLFKTAGLLASNGFGAVRAAVSDDL